MHINTNYVFLNFHKSRLDDHQFIHWTLQLAKIFSLCSNIISIYNSKNGYKIMYRYTSYALIVLGLVTRSCPTLVTPWNVAHRAPLSIGFSRQKYWSRLPFPSPGGSTQPRDRTWVSCTADKFFTDWPTREALCTYYMHIILKKIDTWCHTHLGEKSMLFSFYR